VAHPAAELERTMPLTATVVSALPDRSEVNDASEQHKTILQRMLGRLAG
jgi:hypothetical protein